MQLERLKISGHVHHRLSARSPAGLGEPGAARGVSHALSPTVFSPGGELEFFFSSSPWPSFFGFMAPTPNVGLTGPCGEPRQRRGRSLAPVPPAERALPGADGDSLWKFGSVTFERQCGEREREKVS